MLACHCPTKCFMKLDAMRLKVKQPWSASSLTLSSVLNFPEKIKNSHLQSCANSHIDWCRKKQHMRLAKIQGATAS